MKKQKKIPPLSPDFEQPIGAALHVEDPTPLLAATHLFAIGSLEEMFEILIKIEQEIINLKQSISQEEGEENQSIITLSHHISRFLPLFLRFINISGINAQTYFNAQN